MGVLGAIVAALRLARSSKRGQVSVGGGAAVAVGVLLKWLAGRRRAIPPVRATGVQANAVHAQDPAHRK